MKETIVMINKSKSWFSEKIKKNWQTISQTHEEEKRKDSNKIRNAKGEVSIDNKEIQNKRLLWATICQ